MADIGNLVVENNLMLKLICEKLKINEALYNKRGRDTIGVSLEDKVRELTDMGFSKKEIANTLNISVSTVARCRRHNKYEDEQNNMFDDILKMVDFDDFKDDLEKITIDDDID